MHSYQITALLLHATSLLTLSCAAPTQAADLAPRSCATEYPSVISFLEKQDPNHAGTNGTFFITWKDPSVVSGRPIPNGLSMDGLLQFDNIPRDAWGCQLQLFFPRGYWTLFGLPGGTNRFNVYRVIDPIKPGVSWNTAPKPAYLFGSTPQLKTDQTVPEDVKFVINSVKCEPTLSFRAGIPPEVERGGVEFWRESPFGNAGFRLTHDC
ncbi:hypothetical protein H2199_008805 [Coniosporium tulheliwenetii]|uniref:Uncharacterized protein n=1 Tax=Coniosporium tulheliwenetii TaxID=3383036 RepID=A0ACC2YI69_9PEZI|nr:hypothetical protein H2199_008805 [Cladosporium sp. JES 115]